jgi:hypothetical protein
MSEQLKLIYRGYEIQYNDATEHWYCLDIQALVSRGKRRVGGGLDEVHSDLLSDASLKKVKAEIDKFLAEMRKGAGVEAYLIDGGGPRMTPCMVVEYTGLKKTYSDKQPDHKVSTMAIRSGNSKPSRMEGSMRGIMPNTDEAHSAFAAAFAAAEKVREAQIEYERVFALIPRLQLEHIPELVKIHDRMKLGPAEEIANENQE